MSATSEVCAVCEKPAPDGSRCSSCHLVSYCSRKHQKQDWPRHKASCCAYEVKHSPEFGPYVVAARNIKKDDVIVEEVPLVIGPSHTTEHSQSCLGCFCEGKAKAPCEICDWPLCDSEDPCFGATVTHASLECLLLRHIRASAIYSLNTILPLRCLIIQHLHPKQWKVLEGFAQRAVALLTNLARLQHSRESEICFLESILKPLNKVRPQALPTCTPENVRKVYHMLDAFGLHLKLPWTGVLTAVCAVTSSMEHSCMPNSRRKLNLEPPINGKPFRYKVVVRATKDIAKGERITTMFVDSMACTLTRQFWLKLRRNVTCKCVRCLDPTELGTNFGTLRCIANDGWVLPINTSDILESDWKCTGKCQSVYPKDAVQGIIGDIKVAIAAIDVSEDKGDPKRYVELLNGDLRYLLHPNHHLCIVVKRNVLILQTPRKNGASSDTHLRRIADYCGDIYNVLKHPCFNEMVAPYREDSVLALHATLKEILRRSDAAGAGRTLRSYEHEETEEKLEEILNHALELQDDKYEKMAWFRPYYTW